MSSHGQSGKQSGCAEVVELHFEMVAMLHAIRSLPLPIIRIMYIM